MKSADDYCYGSKLVSPFVRHLKYKWEGRPVAARCLPPPPHASTNVDAAPRGMWHSGWHNYPVWSEIVRKHVSGESGGGGRLTVGEIGNPCVTGRCRRLGEGQQERCSSTSPHGRGEE